MPATVAAPAPSQAERQQRELRPAADVVAVFAVERVRVAARVIACRRAVIRDGRSWRFLVYGFACGVTRDRGNPRGW